MSLPQRHACAVPSCTLALRKEVEDLSFHRFPNGKFRNNARTKWIKIFRQLHGIASWEPLERMVVCSRHFVEGGIQFEGTRRVLDPSAIPTLNMYLASTNTEFQSTEEREMEEQNSVCDSDDTVEHVTTQEAVMELDLVTENDTISMTEYEDPLMTSYDVTCPECSHVISIPVDDIKITNAPLKNETPCVKKARVTGNCRKRLFHEDLPSHDSSLFTTPPLKTIVTPRSRKILRAEHNYAASPNQAADELKTMKTELQKWKRKCINLEEKLARRENSVLSLKQKLQDFKLLSNLEMTSLENRFPGLLKTIMKNEKKALIVKGKTGVTYDEEVRKFAATLHFYSPKAYSFLRDHLTLPHPNTITSWMKSTDCGPGFNSDVIKRLSKARLEDGHNIMTDIVMMIDEMAIHKELIWNASKHCYVGHVNYGMEDTESDFEAPLAANALVCLIAGISGGWKCPIGYIYTEKADSDIQTSFVDRAFFLLEQEGFVVHSLTSDGNSANVSMFQSYGVKESPMNDGQLSFDDVVSSFPNPANNDREVQAIYDIVHVLKLWRNLLAQCGEIITGDGKVINWKYVDNVQGIQEIEKIRAANKLGRYHIEFQNHKMNVRLAVQALSKSTADAIVFCREDLLLEDFQGSEETSSFIYRLDKVFDILNSRNAAQKGQKSALNRSNIALNIYILEDFCKYILQMKYTEIRKYKKTGKEVRVEKLLVQSARRRAVIGMVVSIKSIISVSTHLLYKSETPFKYIMTYRFSQDLLELFFSKVRGRLGKNNNPNVLEFEYVMKRVWHQNLLKSSNTGNCVQQMEDGVIPGGLLPLKTAQKITRLEDEFVEDLELHGFNQPKTSQFYRNCLAYIAGNVVRVVGTNLKCETCAEGLLEHPDDELDTFVKLLIQRKDRGGLFTPCKSVFQLIEAADLVFRGLVAESNGKMNVKNLDNRIVKTVTENCIGSNIFPHIGSHVIDFDPFETESHLSLLIKKIVSHFLRIRLFDYGKRYQKFKVISTRHTLNKVTLFKNQ